MAPNASVARQSHHISATADGEGIFISYEDSSNVVNVMYLAGQTKGFEWRNVTSDVLHLLESDGDTDIQLADICSFSSLMLFCFITNKNGSISGIAQLQIDNAANVSDISFKGKS